MKNKLTIIRGLPGSGKTTYAKKSYNCLILENDMYHIRNGEYEWDKKNMETAILWCLGTCRDALCHGMDVVVSNTFTQKRYVDTYRRIAEETGAEFEVIRCTGEFENQHSVPRFVLENMKRGFEDYPGETIVSFPKTVE